VASAKPSENRSLSEAISAPRAPAQKESSETNLDVSSLTASPNPLLKKAGESIQHGITAFQKATADSMERGDARNGLLKTAHDDFETSLGLLDKADDPKSDDLVKRLQVRVSMLLYASLKYQSL
jgi:hypothetical protein